ncbi:MAG TPA: hypothetical protein VJR89_02170 [Polyangiales bacterium]|nr:hypothetical protein [Polyangiales bacterium]
MAKVDVNQSYVRAPGGTASLIVDRTTIGPHSTFELYWLDRKLGGNGQETYNNKTIGVYSPSSMRYVRAESEGTSNLRANRTQLQSWETFTIQDPASDGSIALKGVNNQWVQTLANETVFASASSPSQTSARQELAQLTDYIFALRSRANNKYRSSGGTLENMGWRWVVELGLNGGPERWAVDLARVGVFQPRYRRRDATRRPAPRTSVL